MVSTRQMTGGSSDESSLHFFRATPTASQSCPATIPSSSAGSTLTNNRTVTTSNGSQPNNQPPAATAVGLFEIGLSCASNNLANATGMASAIQPLIIIPSALETQDCPRQDVNIMDLPAELLGHIFSYVGFKKIAQMRTISHQMNQVCSSILNSTFQKLQNQMHSRFQTVKAKMPRRESARRNHPLACECDILETCYMRLSLLQMTFGKHIERKHCCFFPGAILDEVYSVLSYIRTATSLDRPFKVTDELFDLSTMAMEYFKEHIEPNLPDIAYFTNSTKSFAAPETSSSILSRETSHSNSSSPPQSNMVLRKGIRKIKQGMKRYNNQLTVLRSELRTCKRKATEQAKTITEQQKLMAEQQKQTLEFANRLDETDKKNEELSRKFSTVLQELNKCKTELQYWRSNSPINATSRTSEEVLGSDVLNFFSKPKDAFNDNNDAELLTHYKEDGVPAAATNSNNIKEKTGQRSLTTVPKSKLGVEMNQNFLPKNLIESCAYSSTLLKPGQKRKLDRAVVTDPTCSSDDALGDNVVVQLDGSACLNPPFASASLAASLSSSAQAVTSNTTTVEVLSPSRAFQPTYGKDQSTSQLGNEHSEKEGMANRAVHVIKDMNEFVQQTPGENETARNMVHTEPNVNAAIVTEPTTQHTVTETLDDYLLTNTSANLGNPSDNTSRTSDIIIDQNKKLRRVQNKARSQSNKHIKHSAVANMHIKATRSKPSDK